MNSVERYRHRYSEHASASAEPSWLRSAREAAFNHFSQTGFPKPREERWKYTRTDAIERTHFAVRAADASHLARRELEQLSLDLDAHVMAFVDGHYRADLSSAGSPRGISFAGPLEEAIRSHSDALSRVFAQVADSKLHAFTALNTALTQQGAFINIEPGATIDKPILLLFVAHQETLPDGAATEALPRIVLKVGEGASLNLVQHFVGAQETPYLNNVLTEIELDQHARLEHYVLQQESTQAYHLHSLATRQSAHSHYRLHALATGAKLSRHDVHVALNGTNANCEMNGLYFVGGAQHVDFHTEIDHAVADCRSREDFKGILLDRSRGVFNGRILVRPDAQRTDSAQSNHNLLLSRDAEIDTKPELEIYADDVKCAHGTTVGQLDEDMLFYLRSRGIAEALARAMLTYGFGQDLIDRMELEPIRDFVAHTLLDALPHANELRSIMK